MKNLILLVIFLCSTLCTMRLQAQSNTDTIQIVKKQYARYYYEGKLIKPGAMVNLTRSVPEAYKESVIAKNKNDVAGIFAFTGGFIVGWQLASVIQKKSAPLSVTLIGAGAIIASIPFSRSYAKHTARAVDLYNVEQNKSMGQEYQTLELGIVSGGLGIRFSY